MIDIYFIEFYINRVYNKKLEEYFGVVSSVTSGWRHGKFPEKRLHEFCFKENSNNIFELFERIYKKEQRFFNIYTKKSLL